MGWWSWSTADYYKRATKGFDKWFHSFWKPVAVVKHCKLDIDLYVCGSEQAAIDKFKDVNGHYPEIKPGKIISGFGGFTAGNQIYVISAFTVRGIFLNPLTVGHEIIEYLDGRYVDIIEADNYGDDGIYPD